MIAFHPVPLSTAPDFRPSAEGIDCLHDHALPEHSLQNAAGSPCQTALKARLIACGRTQSLYRLNRKALQHILRLPLSSPTQKS